MLSLNIQLASQVMQERYVDDDDVVVVARAYFQYAFFVKLFKAVRSMLS